MFRNWPEIRRLKPRDKRGVTAVIFALSATAVIGLVGLGTEGGLWALTRRNAQDAADPAAYAGAVRLAYVQAAFPAPNNSFANAKAQADTTARDTTRRNQFPANQAWTNVEVNIPPTSGPNAGNNTAVEVIVRRTPPRLISGLFLAADPTISARGVAALTDNGPACLLANPPPNGNVTGQLLFGGATGVLAPNCILASNSSRSDAISFTGNKASVDTEGLVSAGGCSGCDGPRVSADQGVTTGMATDNPLSARDAGLLGLLNALPPLNSGSCQQISPRVNLGNGSISGTDPLFIDPPAAGKAYCALVVQNGSPPVTFRPGIYRFHSNNINKAALSITGGTVTFGAGTYYFYGSPLSITGSDDVNGITGTGVSFLFTGPSNQVGGPDIRGNPLIKLTAPLDGQGNPSPVLDGILFYRDARATNGNTQGNPAVSINGGASVTLNGAMYFPNSYVKYSGSSDDSLCAVLVGGTIEMTGSSGLTVSNCQQFGSITPMTKIVRLVE